MNDGEAQIGTLEPWAEWADYYDLSVGGHDPFIAFNRSLITEGTRSLLEIGCGTGTIVIALAEEVAGGDGSSRRHPVVGLDQSPEMLRVARSREERIDWVLGDMRSPPIEGQFDLVIACYNTLQFNLGDDDLAHTLRAVKRLLSPDGVFAFDIYQPNLDYIGIPQTDRLARSITDEDGRRLEVREDTRYDPQSRVLAIDWRLIDPGKPDSPALARTHYRMRQYFPAEIEDALAAAGLAIRERFGDLHRSPFTAESKKQVVVCGPA